MTELLYRGRFLLLRQRGRWEFCERTNASGVVVVAALTPDRELLLIEQDRPPVEASVIELPAGLAGDDPASTDEPLAAAAARELEEETGYRPRSLHHVGRGPSSGGLTSELIDFFIAPETEHVGPGGGTEDEAITVHRVPFEAVPAWLDGHVVAGRLIDPKVYTGLWHLERWLAEAARSGLA